MFSMHKIAHIICLFISITSSVRGRGRIVNGKKVKLKKYPYTVAVISRTGGKGADLCGGSILRREWILTAAHCLPEDPARVIVIAGDVNWKEETSEGRQVADALELFKHGDWNETGKMENDVALVLLSRYLSFNEFVSPIPLPSKPESLKIGTSCFISGWGLTEMGHMSDTLMQGEVFVLNDTACETAFGNKVLQGQMCVGNRELGVGYCVGDSGSPYACAGGRGSKRCLYGLDSLGALNEDFCQKAPSVATRVSYYLRFIENTIEANSKPLILILQSKMFYVVTASLATFLLILLVSSLFIKRNRKQKERYQKDFTSILENIE